LISPFDLTGLFHFQDVEKVGMSESSTWKRAAVVASLSVGSYIIFKMTRPSKSKPKYALWGKQVELDIPKQVFPTDAELQAMESTMPQCQHGWFESTSGLQLHYRKFLPSAEKLKGVVVYQHGIQTHSGKSFVMKETGRKLNMALMSERLLKAGYAVYGLDMLGHGYSEGDRWYIPDWVVNRDDLDNFAHFVSAQHANVPLFLEGESYGGTLVLHVAKKWQLDSNHAPNEFAGIILSGPAIMADVPPFPVYVLLRYVLAPAYPKWIPFFMPNPISPDRIWVDEKVRALHVAPRNKEMCIDGSGRPFRLGTAVNMLHALELARSTIIPGLNVPFCVIHGVKDEGCPVEGTYYLDEIAETAAEDRSYHRLEKAYHDLLGDPAAEQTMEYMVDFMNKQVAKQK
jgi:alpha-beta hydrolase superfamily lysophospholipase